ncbi:DASH complex subunit spc19 protein [Rutstroemia sp. NJR-2017a BBW]|nr:DASH complex subunit spc19 protein [Rutstroemia sp. NJR-2017a BBW]
MSTPPPSQLLSSSVASLRSSLTTLDNSISILDAGISDFPRLKTVLSATRHFELTPQSHLLQAQKSLSEELSPAIETLLARTEAHISRLQRREEGLIARGDLLEGRLGGNASKGGKVGGIGMSGKGKGRGIGGGGIGGKAGGMGKGKDLGGKEGQEEKAMRLKVLRQKKERLGYAVERLGLQSQQRQRQLRKSIAPGMGGFDWVDDIMDQLGESGEGEV